MVLVLHQLVHVVQVEEQLAAVSDHPHHTEHLHVVADHALGGSGHVLERAGRVDAAAPVGELLLEQGHVQIAVALVALLVCHLGGHYGEEGRDADAAGHEHGGVRGEVRGRLGRSVERALHHDHSAVSQLLVCDQRVQLPRPVPTGCDEEVEVVGSHTRGQREGVPLGLGDRRHLDAVVAARVRLLRARNRQEGDSVAAGAAGGQGGDERHVEVVVAALQQQQRRDGDEERPQPRHVHDDERRPQHVPEVRQEEDTVVGAALAAQESRARHGQ
mmetsp:Transcript_9362/g.20538  ORF Transcript_9362/g.20538 Transcript_9362/m.20538 type:complete len:273 (+) Transcript_9362:553-1371(+)